jgi:hypothetical protein
VFHGSVFLQQGQLEIEIDSRASDAIAIAVRTGARILVADDVFDRSSIATEGSEEDEGKLGVFRQFIEGLPDEPSFRPREPGEPPQTSG